MDVGTDPAWLSSAIVDVAGFGLKPKKDRVTFMRVDGFRVAELQ